jgi:hypothetical protein
MVVPGQMKLAIRSFVASIVLVSTWGHPESAWAKGERVFVERFDGPGTAPFRRMVLQALDDQGAWVVPAAQRSTAVIVLTGTVSRYRRVYVAVLSATGPDGEELGRPGTWLGRTVPATLVVARRNVDRKVGALLAQIPTTDHRDVAKASTEPVRDAKTDVNDEVDKILDEALGSPEAPSTVATTQEYEEEERPARARRGADEPSVSDDAEQDDEPDGKDDPEEDEPIRPKLHALDLWVGTHFYGRSFQYNQNFSGRQDSYEAPVVPSAALSLDYFFANHVGVTLGGEYAVGLSSQQVQGGGTLQTKALGYFVGGMFRHVTSGGTELLAGLAYAVNRFEVTSDRTTDAMALRLPGVEYVQARMGGSIRFAANKDISLLGGANYLHLLSLGELTSAYFPRATGHGGEGHGGVAIRFAAQSGLEARVMVDLRRYVFAMNSMRTDEHVVGGAVDQYLGINVGIGYRP